MVLRETRVRAETQGGGATMGNYTSQRHCEQREAFQCVVPCRTSHAHPRRPVLDTGLG